MYNDNFKNEVLAHTDIVALIARDVHLKRRGREYIGLCPFHVEKTPSFHVMPSKGFYHCFGCQESGDAIKYLMVKHRTIFADALNELAILAGLGNGHAHARHNWNNSVDALQKQHEQAMRLARQEAKDRARRLTLAKQYWQDDNDDALALVKNYLSHHRHINLNKLTMHDLPPTIRGGYHAHPLDKRVRPVMLCLFQNGNGGGVATHRTFLKKCDDGRMIKSSIVSNKRIDGVMKGASIRLCYAEPRLYMAEGVETALSVQMAGVPCWAAGSLWNMGACLLPPLVKELVLCLDSDSDKGVMDKMLIKARAHYNSHGIQLFIVRAPDGQDFNDMLGGDNE